MSTDDEFDGRLYEGQVALTRDPDGSGWAAHCERAGCDWADSAGPLGFQGLRAMARHHSH